MAIFRVPRITTTQRLGLLMDVGEIVYDTDQKVFYGGDGIVPGGFLIGQSAGSIIEIVTLTQDDIDAKQVTLNTTPLSPSTVIVTPEGGIPQINGIDYTIAGNILSWDGLGLDGFLEVNEVLIVQH